jgi:putative transcriptional regulator
MSTAGKRLIGAAREAAAIARGEKKPARLHVFPEIDVKAVRAGLDFSQEEFAAAFGFTANQIKDWEQGRSRPLGGNRAYLMIIKRDPQAVIAMLRAPRSGKNAA